MKKTAGLCPAILIMALSLSGCGGVSMDVDTSTLYVGSNGKITEVVVEDFGEDYYDEEELKSHIDDAVSYYEDTGKSGVKVKKCEVKNGVARLLMEYKDAESYAAFNEAEMYIGTLLQAQADGYEFDVEFQTPEQSAEAETEAEETVLPEEAGTENVIEGQIIEDNTETVYEPQADSQALTGALTEEVLSDETRKVLILEQDTDVKVKGEILYVSDHVKVTGKDTAVVYGEGSDSADTGLAYIIYK